MLYSLEWNIKLSWEIIQKNIDNAITSKYVDFNAVKDSLPTKGRTRNTFTQVLVDYFLAFWAFSPLKYIWLMYIIYLWNIFESIFTLCNKYNKC